jgi:hypothetical protein
LAAGTGQRETTVKNILAPAHVGKFYDASLCDLAHFLRKVVAVRKLATEATDPAA